MGGRSQDERSVRSNRAFCALFAVTLVFAACSSGHTSGSAGPGHSGSKPPSAHFTGFWNGAYYEDGKITAASDARAADARAADGAKNGKAGAIGKTTTTLSSRPPTTFFQQNDVKVGVDEEIGEFSCWKAGDSCEVGLQGVVYLGTLPKGKVSLQAIENDVPTPVATRELSPVPQGKTVLCEVDGCPFGGAWLHYTVSKGARKVQFRVVLSSPEGVPLATGNTDTYALGN